MNLKQRGFVHFRKLFDQRLLGLILFALISIMLPFSDTLAACGAFQRTWSSTGNSNWNNANWGGNQPNGTNEDAIIVNTGVGVNIDNKTVACMDVQSGVLNGNANRVLSVTGDFFSAPNANTLNFTNNRAEIAMVGTAPQTFECVDEIRILTLNNPTSVTLKNTFRVRRDINFLGTGTTYIEGDVRIERATTIAAGHTVIIKNGGRIWMRNNLTLNGVLQIDAGGELMMRGGRTLTVGTTGFLKVLGASGNSARLISEAGDQYFNFNLNGTMAANYFYISRPQTAGINMSNTGAITQLDNGEFHGIRNNGRAITLSANSTMPANPDKIGFF
ncbi:MAG: hypothetical protein HOM21_03745, partial [Halobacteriovoraceae bacterium]|nr:hypothetical protein [Halobacteriovoraceae bacterium]